jgi:hypothetical protein
VNILEKLLPSIITGLAQKELKRGEVTAAEVGQEFEVTGVAHGLKIWGRRFELGLVLKVTR